MYQDLSGFIYYVYHRKMYYAYDLWKVILFL